MNQVATKAATARVAETPRCAPPVLSIGAGGIAATSSATLSAKPHLAKTSIVIMKVVKTMATLQVSIFVSQLSIDEKLSVNS